MNAPLLLVPAKISLSQLATLYHEAPQIKLDPACKPQIDEAACLVERCAAGDKAVYGVNTGFGKLASIKIAPQDTAILQRNLIRSHCSGLGDVQAPKITRLMMILKLISLGRGASGVRWHVMMLLEAMINHQLIPQVPLQGSVGASGDLAPLAHMTAAMMGEGQVFYQQQIMQADKALSMAGLSPITLAAKEGLGFINGTQFSTANALAALFDGWRSVEAALIGGALATDAIMGSTAPFHPKIHELRGHQGQIAVANTLRDLLQGSTIRNHHLQGDSRVQDPYCIRCQPQVMGAAIDLIKQAATSLTIEANAVTDNPLVLCGEDIIVSGGNFHAEPVAFAADMLALAFAEIGAITQRRIALMVDPNLSFDLPPFLTPAPGLNSGYMVAEIASATLMSENKHLANPCSTDSTPTSANQEDHVSMAAHGACRLHRMIRNLNYIVAIEFMCAAQGIEYRAPLLTSTALKGIIAEIRTAVPRLAEDHALSHEIETLAQHISDGHYQSCVRDYLPKL